MTEQRLHEMATNASTSKLLSINAPEWFADPAFVNWLNNDTTKATWHTKGSQPGDYSDVFVSYDSGDGSNAHADDDIPGPIWSQIARVVEKKFGTRHIALCIRLTNLPE